jgi:hypothetical protein
MSHRRTGLQQTKPQTRRAWTDVLHKGVNGLTPDQRGLLDLPVDPPPPLPPLTVWTAWRATIDLWRQWWHDWRRKPLRRPW